MDWYFHYHAAILVLSLTSFTTLKCQTTATGRSKVTSGSGSISDNGLQSFMCKTVQNVNSRNSYDDHSLASSVKLPPTHQSGSEGLNCELKSKQTGFVKIHKGEFKGDRINSNLFNLNNVTYLRSEFCINSISDDHLEFSVCNEIEQNPTSNKLRTVLNKCCEINEQILIHSDETFVGSKYSCVPKKNGLQWEPPLFNSTSGDFRHHSHIKDSHLQASYRIGYPNCTDFKELDNNKDIWFKIQEDGSVVIGLKFWFRPVWLKINNHGFCVDEFESQDNIHLSNEQNNHQLNLTASSQLSLDSNGHSSNHKNQILLYCGIQRFNDYMFHRKLFGSLCILASIIILILLIIYLSIWDKQNLAGWTQFNIFLAVFFVFGMEGTRTLVDSNGLNVQATPACAIIAAIAQYFFFAVNTTWSVMCFDLFWTFWKLQASVKGIKEHSKRLIGYCIFSWGLPLIIVCVAFGYSHLSATDAQERMEGVYAFAHRRCSSPIRELGFQTQGIMFLLNLCFFSCTAFFIWKHRRGINASRRNSRSEKYTWTSVILFVKLLIVMGVSSLSIPMDYFFGSDDPLSYFAVLLRGVHLIPVVAVLFIFGFNEKNLRLMKQKYSTFGEVMELCNIKPGGTDTNPSRSEVKNSTNQT